MLPLFLSILVLKPPQPIIEIRGEPLIHVADFGNEILDFNITNTLLTGWILTGLLTIICLVAVRKRSLTAQRLLQLLRGNH